jgi:hypothetical protein
MTAAMNQHECTHVITPFSSVGKRIDEHYPWGWDTVKFPMNGMISRIAVFPAIGAVFLDH